MKDPAQDLDPDPHPDLAQDQDLGPDQGPDPDLDRIIEMMKQRKQVQVMTKKLKMSKSQRVKI